MLENPEGIYCDCTSASLVTSHHIPLSAYFCSIFTKVNIKTAAIITKLTAKMGVIIFVNNKN
jgi:hypothetical protein